MSSESSVIAHHERIASERYACIFRTLAKFDKQTCLYNFEYTAPLIRAALHRAHFKIKKNSVKHAQKLLCITTNLVSNRLSLLSSSSFFQLFHGLQQSGKYREYILAGLWNYQCFNIRIEQTFNQWLSSQSSACSICFMFLANQSNRFCSNNSSIPIIRRLTVTDIDNHSSTMSNEYLQCSSCHVTVHRQCYECVCLAGNAPIEDECNPWVCQRCSFKCQVRYSIDADNEYGSTSIHYSSRRCLSMIVVQLVYYVVVFFSIRNHLHHVCMRYVPSIKLINHQRRRRRRRLNARRVNIVGRFVR
jgi:hypothetical protein